MSRNDFCPRENDFDFARTVFADRLRDHMCEFFPDEIEFAETTYDGDVHVHIAFSDVTFVVTLRVDMTNCVINPVIANMEKNDA